MLRDHPVTWLHLSGSRSDGRSGNHLQTVWHRSGTGVVPGQFPVVPLRGHPVVKMYAPPEQLIGFYDLGSH